MFFFFSFLTKKGGWDHGHIRRVEVRFFPFSTLMLIVYHGRKGEDHFGGGLRIEEGGSLMRSSDPLWCIVIRNHLFNNAYHSCI